MKKHQKRRKVNPIFGRILASSRVIRMYLGKRFEMIYEIRKLLKIASFFLKVFMFLVDRMSIVRLFRALVSETANELESTVWEKHE